MLIRRADAETEQGCLPSRELLAAMGAYNEEMMKAGVLRSGEGLHPSSKGARVKFQGGEPRVVDGPFAETKELIAGFTLIEVESLREAIEWVKRWPAEDANGAAEIEIRSLYEADDFGDAFAPELREAEERMREELAASIAKGPQS